MWNQNRQFFSIFKVINCFEKICTKNSSMLDIIFFLEGVITFIFLLQTLTYRQIFFIFIFVCLKKIVNIPVPSVKTPRCYRLITKCSDRMHFSFKEIVSCTRRSTCTACRFHNKRCFLEITPWRMAVSFSYCHCFCCFYVYTHVKAFTQSVQ